ncbi:MAG: HutD family protein [Xanthomonadaceae bacterium]|nr:HutD family protein [Xanthomonadaceae bacterium]
MNSSIVRAHDCLPQAWKNGLGRTRQIAVQPSTAGSGDFLWRVSVAEVDSAAPFSLFPGIDRHIVLLDGAGFTMALDDGREHALATPLAPFAFPGEAQVSVRLVAGPTRDFNLMVRRALARGTVDVWREPGVRRLDPQTVLVYAAHGEIDTADGTLQAGDAWRASTPAAGTVTLRDGAQALAIGIERTA